MTTDQTISRPGQQPRRPLNRFKLLVLGSVGTVAVMALATRALPAMAQTPSQNPLASGSAPTAAPPVTVETVTVRAQRRLLKERNSPSASTELGAAQISQVGVTGSIASLLRAAPSVYVYQQGIGNDEPVLSIRGVRGLETADTLDGVPMQDLLNGGSGSYLNAIIGGKFNLDQISGVSIYPGVAYPDLNTFGTIGGTVAYDSLRPSKDAQIVLTGSAGSFKTYNEGIELDSGQFDSGLGTGDDGLSLMARYSNLQTAGYIDYSPARYNSFEAAFDKPFDDGLSRIQGTVLFNTGRGLFGDEPVPVPVLDKFGLYSNYPVSEEYNSQATQYLTVYLKGDKYVNDWLGVGATAFYESTYSKTIDYANVNVFQASGYPNPYSLGGALPFIQNVDGFGLESFHGYGGPFYDPGYYEADGNATYPVGTAACPAYLAAEYAGTTSPCGYNSFLDITREHTVGIQPRITITPPDIMGIGNTIKIGGLIAKDMAPADAEYIGATANIPQTPQYAGGIAGDTNARVQRTIFQLYLQDKVDLIDNTLHITPGVTAEGTWSSYIGSQVFDANPTAAEAATPYCMTYGCSYGPFKATKWDRDYLPFLNIAYDFDKIMPAAKGLSIYGSMAQSALFAPTTDFGPTPTNSPPPFASIVHMYEGGVQYDTPKLAFKVDYFYQKIDRDFGFYEFEAGPFAGDQLDSNLAQREIKGFEAAFTYQATPDFQLFGNASHQLDKNLVTALELNTIQQDQYGFVLKDSPSTGVPDWLSTFGVDFNHKSLVEPGDALNIRFEGQYTGHQYTTYDSNGMVDYPALAKFFNAPFGSYEYYEDVAGSTLIDPHGGINPFTIFNLDVNYTMPTPSLKYLRQVTFDLNGLNIFDQHYWQYFYRQISPASCPNFPSGPFKGQPETSYGCTPAFADGVPGEPAAVTLTVTAKF